MFEMPRPRPPYLSHERTRHGRWVWYVRRAGTRIRVKADYGTPAFWREYRAALEGAPEPSPPEARTLAWALDRYRASPAWGGATRRQRENIYIAIIKIAGTTPLKDITTGSIKASRDRRAAAPHAANNFLKAMRGFYKWAAGDGELVKVNPTIGVKLLAGKNKDGFHSWTDEEITRFEERSPLGTRERLALHLLLYTGLARGDVVRLGRQHVSGGVITFRMEKDRGDGYVYPPMLRVLAETIAASKTGELTFLVTEKGLPFVKEGFGNWFRDACRAAGCPGSAHGLRKSGATRAAENGATMLTGKGPSNRHEVFYFAEGSLGAVRIDDYKYRMIDQPDGWVGGTVKLDAPIVSNLRLDPFERMQYPKGNMWSYYFFPNFYVHEFWRFVFLQQKVNESAQTFIDYPPMQRGASFNLEAVKAEIDERVRAMKARTE